MIKYKYHQASQSINQSINQSIKNSNDGYKYLYEIRLFFEDEFKVKSSTIALDILIIVLIYYFEKKAPLSAKLLLADCIHSPTGIRYYLNDLVNDGWIFKNSHVSDKRLCILEPGQRLIQALERFKKRVLSLH